jgi:hypothetical protein
MRTLTLAVLVALLVGIGGYWYVSPMWALRQMQAAARSGDATAFNDFVDYPRVRESLKQELSAQLGRSMGVSGRSEDGVANAAAALGAAIGTAIAGPMVDAAVQPSVVRRAFLQGRLLPRPSLGGATDTDPPDPVGSSDAGAHALTWSARHEDLDHYVADVRRVDEPESQRLGFVLERRGFAHWRLTDLRLPALQP